MENNKNPFNQGKSNPPNKDSSDTVQLTAEMFFGENGHSGYLFTRSTFLVYGESLRDREVQDLAKFFSATKDGLIMGGSLTKRTDRGGKPYVHPEFYKAKARMGVKIILEHGIEGFISDYQNGYVRNLFTLEELINEARKDQNNSNA